MLSECVTITFSKGHVEYYHHLEGRSTELIGSLKLGNVWVFAKLIHRPTPDFG